MTLGNDHPTITPAPMSARSFVPLLYHELRPQPSSYSYVLPCARFAEHLRLFARVQQQSPASSLPLLTFDDGHISSHEYALPMLQQAETTAHFFITAGWTGVRAGYMQRQHLRELHDAGNTIGAHGWSHTLLTECTHSQLRRELNDARTALEDCISAPVTAVSLPGGRSNAKVLQACRAAGYITVWTSVPGEIHTLDSPGIGRFNILSGIADDFLQKLLDPGSGVLRRATRVARAKATAQRVLGDRLYARLWAAVNRLEPELPAVAS